MFSNTSSKRLSVGIICQINRFVHMKTVINLLKKHKKCSIIRILRLIMAKIVI